MNENTKSKQQQVFSAIAVAALLIGTATGNAVIMMALSAVVLAIGLLFFRPRLNAGPLRVVLLAAIVGIVVAAGFAFVLR